MTAEATSAAVGVPIAAVVSELDRRTSKMDINDGIWMRWHRFNFPALIVQ